MGGKAQNESKNRKSFMTDKSQFNKFGWEKKNEKKIKRQNQQPSTTSINSDQNLLPTIIDSGALQFRFHMFLSSTVIYTYSLQMLKNKEKKT